MIIKISDPKGEKSFFIRKLFGFSAVKKLNESGILKISFPDDVVGLEDFEIKKGYLIQAFLPDEKKKVHCVFSGYIEERSISGNVISLVGYDFIGYAKHRMIREDLKFENFSIKAIIEKVVEKLNEISVLPFSLRKNDCEEIVSIEFKAFTSLYQVLKELSKKVAALEIRHASEVDKRKSLEYLDISKQSGEIKEGIRADNANVQQRNSKVIAREWRDNFGNYCNYRRDNNGNVKENQSSIEEGLLFEKFEQNPEKLPDNLNEGDGLPKIVPEVSNAEIAQLQVGDRKQIRLIARLDWARFEYLGIIQETSLNSNSAGGIDFSVKIGEKIIEQKNVLDKTLANLATAVKKSVFSGGSAPASIVDLSGYATSTAVAQALQSQNTKINQKADSSFVAGVAQTAQTALNTANQKAPLQHTHTKNEVGLGAVDNTSDEDKPLSRAAREVLELKANLADIVDSLESEDAAKPLSARQGKILKGFIDQVLLVLASDDTTLDSFREIVAYIKQNKRILSQLGISNIAGLVEALEGKADKEHTHTVGQITDFPSSLPASDVPAWAKKATKPAYTWDEIQEKPEVFPSSTNFIDVNVDTAYNAVAKIGTTTDGNYTPQKGDILLVNFVHGTQAAAPTLNIDGSGAKNIRSGYYNVGTNMLQLGRNTNSNIKVMLRYDGQYYQMFGVGHNTTYGEITEAEINNATLATARLISGRRIAKMKEYFEQNVPTPTAPNHSANKQYVDGEISKIQTSSGGADPTAVHLSGEEEILGHKKFKGGLSIKGVDGPAWRGETLQLRKGAGEERRAMNGKTDYDGGLLFEYLNDGYFNNFLIRRKGGMWFSYFTDTPQDKRWFKLASRSDLAGIPHSQGGHILQFLWGDMTQNGTGGGHDGGRGLEFGTHDNPYLKMIGNNTFLGRTDGHIYPQSRMEMPNHKGLYWNYNSDQAYIYFRSNNNNDTSLDFKLGDDGSERFRFLFNDTRRVARNNRVAMFGQKMFVHKQVDGEPTISLALGDNDTGFNREGDGNFSMYANAQKIQHFNANSVPIVAEGLGHNVKIKKLTQAQYDALGAGRPSNVIYYITD